MADSRLKLSRFSAAVTAAEALALSAEIGSSLLTQLLVVIDDYCLTTRCGEMTTRDYWRRLVPVRGNRDCPDGRGKARDHHHTWTGAAPSLEIPARPPLTPAAELRRPESF